MGVLFEWVVFIFIWVAKMTSNELATIDDGSGDTAENCVYTFIIYVKFYSYLLTPVAFQCGYGTKLKTIFCSPVNGLGLGVIFTLFRLLHSLQHWIPFVAILLALPLAKFLAECNRPAIMFR